MRITFMAPERLTADVARNMLAVVGVPVAQETIGGWTQFELVMAYDWATREYLHASDNTTVRRRDKPSFVQVAQDVEKVLTGLPGGTDD